ncbi:carbohydrate ABC transporter permease [Streptomyces sp. AJS327]|uniref:carbohydrate ABC transporter permease n=1 Tax=Streptomyces sp. AJS327 TaxID=2545265 RepID=UPI0015DD6F22|nr:carbohydrate ABC transporter permease [Streptomyces sp. AJS327]MBA0053219.1 carbohydrate ABC transporter permease [Streptomyces sp. AJS327]
MTATIPPPTTPDPAPGTRRDGRRRHPLGGALATAALTVGALCMLFPFAWMVLTAFQPDGSLGSAPRFGDLTTGAFGRLDDAMPFWRILGNSVWISVVSTLAQLVTSTLAAYAFARFTFRGRETLFTLYLATMMIPQQVLLVPLFVEMKQLGLIDTYAGIMLPGLASAFGTFLIRQAMLTVPRELEEAALVDGAGPMRILWTVVLPLVRPALATFTVFGFMASWNNFLWPLVVTRSPELFTLPLGLSALQGQFTTEWNIVMAGSVISVIPMLLLYLAAQKHVVRSIATTGLK